MSQSTNFSAKDRVKEFAEWLADRDHNPDASELLTYLGTLICMRCGQRRPDIITMSKGGPFCCFRPVP